MNTSVLSLLQSLLLLAMLSNSCFAQGDYSMSLDEKYDFVRCNSIETLITTKSSQILFSPEGFEFVGPVTHFSSGTSYLLLKNCGRKRLFSEPTKTAEVPDHTKTFFFAMRKLDDTVLGPMTDAEFSIFLTEQKLDNPAWKRPIPLRGRLLISIFFIIVLVTISWLLWFMWPKQRASLYASQH